MSIATSPWPTVGVIPLIGVPKQLHSDHWGTFDHTSYTQQLHTIASYKILNESES